MASFTAGTTFVDGVSNDVTAAKLGALVTNATPTSGFIQDRTAETVTATNDTLLIGDASDSNNLKRITVANFAQTLPTAKVTTGTIDTGTFGTTTSTAATITTGTIPTLTTGTTTSTAATITTGTIPTLTTGTTTSTNEVVTNGTITNLSATTSTFLGTITGSTNVVNIGSGQIYKAANGNVTIGTNDAGDTLRYLDIQNTNSSANAGAILRLITRNVADSGNTPVDIVKYKTGGFTISNAETNAAAFTSFNVGASERLRIDSSGNVGIGTASPSRQLTVSGASAAFGITSTAAGGNTVSIDPATTANSNIAQIDCSGANALRFNTNSAERLRIDGANGTLTSQPTYDNTAAGSTVVVTSAGLIRRTSSSLKYKKDIENLDSSIVDNAIDRLRPVWYRTKNPEGDDKSTWSHVGLIAEEVNSVEPRLVRYKTVEVSTNENGERIETQLENPIPEDVDYARLSVILLSEVKAQRIKIASLEARLEALEAK